jgi:hypothetical protein
VFSFFEKQNCTDKTGKIVVRNIGFAICGLLEGKKPEIKYKTLINYVNELRNSEEKEEKYLAEKALKLIINPDECLNGFFFLICF